MDKFRIELGKFRTNELDYTVNVQVPVEQNSGWLKDGRFDTSLGHPKDLCSPGNDCPHHPRTEPFVGQVHSGPKGLVVRDGPKSLAGSGHGHQGAPAQVRQNVKHHLV